MRFLSVHSQDVLSDLDAPFQSLRKRKRMSRSGPRKTFTGRSELVLHSEREVVRYVEKFCRLSLSVSPQLQGLTKEKLGAAFEPAIFLAENRQDATFSVIFGWEGNGINSWSTFDVSLLKGEKYVVRFDGFEYIKRLPTQWNQELDEFE
jgi:hypothetical protein